MRRRRRPTASPVVYDRVRRILERPGTGAEAVRMDPADRPRSMVRIDLVVGMDIDFFFYYPSEVGFGSHAHDVESVEMKLLFGDRPDCPAGCRYGFVVDKVVGKAHGMLWYDNTLAPSAETRFPIHVLVEEGKRASCPDANGDGPGHAWRGVTEDGCAPPLAASARVEGRAATAGHRGLEPRPPA